MTKLILKLVSGLSNPQYNRTYVDAARSRRRLREAVRERTDGPQVTDTGKKRVQPKS
ncbi:MAG: hypothetical protein ACYC7A_14240 [Thermoanaerobaculia bacterium]